MSTRFSRLERTAKDHKKNDLRRLYALEIIHPHKVDISLINHIEYGFIYDGIVNQALLNIFEVKNIHPQYYHTHDEILTMSPQERAALLNTHEFSSRVQLEKYCLHNYVDIISYYSIEAT